MTEKGEEMGGGGGERGRQTDTQRHTERQTEHVLSFGMRIHSGGWGGGGQKMAGGGGGGVIRPWERKNSSSHSCFRFFFSYRSEPIIMYEEKTKLSVHASGCRSPCIRGQLDSK